MNRKAVMRHMHEMGLTAVYPGPNLSKRAHQAAIYPYLLSNIMASYPNHVWGLDITYIRLRQGWLYLVAVLDWYSRSILSWELDQTMQVAFVLAAMQRALAQARPVICNSDQGSQFTSTPYINLLKEHDVQISMDGRERALDNIFTERFVNWFWKLHWVAESSLLKTLAYKHQTSTTFQAKKYKASFQAEDGTIYPCLEIQVQRKGKKPLIARFGAIPLKRQLSVR